MYQGKSGTEAPRLLKRWQVGEREGNRELMSVRMKAPVILCITILHFLTKCKENSNEETKNFLEHVCVYLQFLLEYICDRATRQCLMTCFFLFS